MGWNQCSETHLWLLTNVFRGLYSNSNQWLPECLVYENPDKENIPCVMPVTFYTCGQTQMQMVNVLKFKNKAIKILQ